MRDVSETMTCDNCGRVVQTSEGSIAGRESPRGGWSFQVAHLGYYDGFTDDDDDSHTWTKICHDCVVSLIEAFPAIAARVHPGGHPSMNWPAGTEDGTAAPPCCRWAWAWKNTSESFDLYNVDRNGEWKLAEDSN